MDSSGEAYVLKNLLGLRGPDDGLRVLILLVDVSPNLLD
jgi:hypothetical protein